MNREYSYMYLSIPIHVVAPKRDSWSLVSFVNTCITVHGNKVHGSRN